MPLISEAQTPDYSTLQHWAAHPDKKDLSDSVPPAFSGDKVSRDADVFFIHPTTYTGAAINQEWNAKIDNRAVNENTDNRPILNQASIFNGSCRVFAPRYRQAHIRAFYSPYAAKSMAAFEIAYTDVKAAFEYYLANYHKGRPIIIASHSQGSLYAIRLLQDYFSGKLLLKKLVCAYVVGFPVTAADLKDIPFTKDALSTGCVISWRTYREGHVPGQAEREREGALCTNPVTWKNATEASKITQHKGGYFPAFGVHKQILTARINEQSGILWISLLPQIEKLIGNTSNYHVADYNLFYADIRANIAQRIQAFSSDKR